MPFQHGKDGKVTIGGVTFCVTKWDAEEVYDEHPTDNTCNGDFKGQQLGKRQVTGTLEAQLDLTQSPYTAFPSGQDVAIELFVDKSATVPTFDLPTATPNNVKITSAASDIITWSASFKSNGEYFIDGDGDLESGV